MPMLNEEIYEGLADLIAGQFFGHSYSRGLNFGIIPTMEDERWWITKSPEPV